MPGSPRTCPRAASSAIDPWLHHPGPVEPLKRAAAKAGGELVARSRQSRWTPSGRTSRRRRSRRSVAHDLAYAGEDSAAKRQDIAARLTASRRRRRGAHRAGLDRLAAQHPRRRRAAHAAAARLRHPPCRRPGRSLHRPAQAGAGDRAHLGNAVAVPRARRASRRARRAGQGQGEGAGRSQQRRRLDLRPACRPPARRSSAAPIPAPCPRPARTRSRSRAPAPPICRDGAAVTRFLAWLRRRSAQGQADRTRRRGEAGGVPPRPTT